jgi:hypothetical protein
MLYEKLDFFGVFFLYICSALNAAKPLRINNT